MLHSGTPPAGEFTCSDPPVNQLQRNIQRSQRGNFLEVPTDCPQRDERLGWMGNAQAFVGHGRPQRGVSRIPSSCQGMIENAKSKVSQNMDFFLLSSPVMIRFVNCLRASSCFAQQRGISLP